MKLSASSKDLEKLYLSIAPEKSGILRFNRCDLKGSSKFTYLGFDFYWSLTRNGKSTVKRRTNKQKYTAALKSLKTWMKGKRHTPLKGLKKNLRSKLSGHFNYYGVIRNSRMLSQFFNAARWIIYRVLNERSQKTSYNWKGFREMWKTLDIPNPKIIEIHKLVRTCALNLT